MAMGLGEELIAWARRLRTELISPGKDWGTVLLSSPRVTRG